MVGSGEPRTRRRVFGFGIAPLLVACALGLTPGAVPAQSEDHVIALEIVARAVEVPANTLRVTQGEWVELRWTSDEPAELHLHGYDVTVAVAPDAPATMRFQADATGRFPITSHGFGGSHDGDHATLLYLEVHPR